jgi:GTPase SAR1 family protein
LWGNQLRDVPDSLSDLTKLNALYLEENELTKVPASLGNLIALNVLYLAVNRLTEIPASLGNLTALGQLNLSKNQLTTLPKELADIAASGALALDNNPLSDPLPELIARGPHDLATYLRSLDDAVAQYEAKLLLVGEGNVGKTSLVAALKGAPFVEGRSTTHGIEISSIMFRHPSLDRDMTLRSWDFGGQEVYRVSHQFFFSGRALYLVVWHARQGQEQDEVEGWLRRIKLRVGHDASTILVATHCKERLPELDYPHLQQLFPGMLTGAFNVDSSTGDGIHGLREAISVQAAQLQIYYQQFAGICQQHGLSDSETSTLAKLMHDLGLVIYYDEDEGLRDVVVLNPEWLTKAISYVLDDQPTVEAGGVLDTYGSERSGKTARTGTLLITTPTSYGLWRNLISPTA